MTIRFYLFILTIAIIFSFFGCDIQPKKIGTTYLDVTYIYNVDIKENVVGDSDYVFVGKVINELETNYDLIEELPYTMYRVNVLTNIKGTLLPNVDVNIGGGLSESGEEYILRAKSFLPTVNDIYIFLVRAIEGGQIITTSHSNLYVCSENYKNDVIYSEILTAYENEIIPYDRVRYKSSFDKSDK